MEARGDEQHKPLTGDSLLFGDERHAAKSLSAGGCGGEGKRRRADDPAPLLLSGEGESKKCRPDDPALLLFAGEAEGKKYRPEDPALLHLPDEAEGKKYRPDKPAPLLRVGEAESKKRCPDDPALLILPVEAERKKYRPDKSAPGEAESMKRRPDKPAPLRADGPAPVLRADHLLPLGEAEGRKRCAGALGPLLPLGEAEKRRPQESAPGEVEGKKWRPDEPAMLRVGEAESNKLRPDEPAPLLLADDPAPLLRADHLLPLGRPAGGLASLLSLGEAEGMKRSAEPKRRSDENLPPPPVTQRTPALIYEAVRANGSPPRRRMHLLPESESDEEEEDPVALALYWRGVARDDQYDPYIDYFFVGRPQPDSWYKVWLERPLELHDAGLVAAVDSVITWGAGPRTGYLDVSDRIDTVLQSHPGPVSTFRLDSSEFPRGQHLKRWMSLLTLKQAKKVVLINLTAPIEKCEVPLDQLRSTGLCYLGLGFLNLLECLGNCLVSAGQHGHPWSTIRDLSLTGCLFWGPDLAHTVYDLWGLEMLRIANCDLTHGCDQETGFQLESPKLKSVIFSGCTASEKVVLGRAPALSTLQLGVLCPVPSPTSHPIHIRFCEQLHELHLSLPYHDVTLWSSYITKVDRKTMLSFRSLRNLVTTVNMCTISGTEALVGFLTMVPHLQKLTVLSAHSGDSDGPDFPSTFESVVGVTNSLQHLTVSHFTGGRGEVTFILAILAEAQRLLSVAVNSHSSMPLSLREAAKFFKERPTASKHCRVRVGVCSDCGSS